MKLTLLALKQHQEWINKARLVFREPLANIEMNFVSTEIENYQPNSKQVFYISPSNSLCFMDGGIDRAYMEMFRGIEKLVKNNVSKLGYKTKLGRSYLPIGRAVITNVGIGKYLVSSPTMLLPQDISGTDNVYYCMRAVLNLLLEYEIMEDSEIIVVPLGCGYGKMTYENSLEQIKRAFVVSEIFTEDRLNDIINEQPDYYDNSEWKDIDSASIIKH